MSDIDHMMKAPMQPDPEAKLIATFGGDFNVAPLASKNDLAAGEPRKPRPKATAPIATPGPSGGRPPLFRR
jgi:hypothetical protein